MTIGKNHDGRLHFFSTRIRILLPGGNIIAEKVGRHFVHSHVENILGGKLPDYVPYHEKQ